MSNFNPTTTTATKCGQTNVALTRKCCVTVGVASPLTTARGCSDICMIYHRGSWSLCVTVRPPSSSPGMFNLGLDRTGTMVRPIGLTETGPDRRWVRSRFGLGLMSMIQMSVRSYNSPRPSVRSRSGPRGLDRSVGPPSDRLEGCSMRSCLKS